MGNVLSNLNVFNTSVMLAGAAYTTLFYSGGIVAGKGALVTMGSLTLSPILVNALIVALGALALIVGLIIVVHMVKFVVYKIVDGINYIKQVFVGDNDIDDHAAEGERTFREKHPEFFPSNPSKQWLEMIELLAQELRSLDLTEYALQITKIGKENIPQRSVSDLTEITIKILNEIQTTRKSSETTEKKKRDEEGFCIWKLCQLGFKCLFKCIESNIIPAMPGTEFTLVFFIVFASFFKLGGCLNHQTNVATFTDLDETCKQKCLRKIPLVHEPIQFPGNIYKLLKVHLSEMLESSYFLNFFTKITEKNECDPNYDAKGVVYLFKCKHCTINSINTAQIRAFYVGITQGELKIRLSGHRSSIKTKKLKTVAIHINSPPGEGHGLIERTFNDALLDNYYVNMLVIDPGSKKVDLRPYEVFFQWLIGSEHVMNKR